MARRILLTLSVVLVAALAWAGDPWKEKSYKEWDEKDVKKIISDSPWSRTVYISGGGSREDRSSPGAGGTSSTGGYSAPGSNTSASRSTEDQESAPSQIPFLVRWVSSRTFREALARNAVLQKRAQEADADKFIEQQPEEYIIAIAGEDMRLFSRADDAGLKEKSYLMTKKNKQKWTPLRVEIRRTEDSKRVVSATFYFARKTEGGEPVVSADEKELEFSAQVGSVLIKANFSPQKMVAKAGMDL